MHFGLLPRANRGLFAINELPDLASKVQVGLFNILQEGDVQIKGYPVRLRLDVALVFTRQPRGLHRARQDHHAAQGPDRIGDSHALSAHALGSDDDHRTGSLDRQPRCAEPRPLPVQVPDFVREIVEEVAFQARGDQKVDKRSGVSQRLPISALENVVSNAERRALDTGEAVAVPRVERHLRVAAVAHRQDRARVRRRAQRRGNRGARDRPRGDRDGLRRPRRPDRHPSRHRLVRARRRNRSLGYFIGSRRLAAVEPIDGFDRVAKSLGANDRDQDGTRAAIADFILEGLCALKKISRTDSGRLHAAPGAATPRERGDERTLQSLMDEDETPVKGKKKYYN